ncbi:MAG: winged helix-turn-helix transcriptional regulator [Gemmatimonadota bacterium]|nr:MAG: winged helix-turn-helix transcriptional regulator [Gemmatimonadota bacterium]
MQADPQDIRRAAAIFKALSHPSRLKIVCLLFDGRCRTQKELVEELNWPQSTTARHLSRLRERGLVIAKRHGPEVHLELGSHVTRQIMGAVCEWVHPETGEQFAGSYAELLAQEAE